jgi:hypothetical protein
MVRAKIEAPPSVRSSLVTEVMTAYFRPSERTTPAMRPGSASSGAEGLPLATAQKLQVRVHVSPRMRNVAVRLDQHSPMFGQRALWQIVWSRCAFRISETRKKFGSDGSLTLSQTGFLSLPGVPLPSGGPGIRAVLFTRFFFDC